MRMVATPVEKEWITLENFEDALIKFNTKILKVGDVFQTQYEAQNIEVNYESNNKAFVSYNQIMLHDQVGNSQNRQYITLIKRKKLEN